MSTYTEHERHDAPVNLETKLPQINIGVLLATVLIQVLPGTVDALALVVGGDLLRDLDGLVALALVG